MSDVLARFMAKFVVTDSGCWEWQAGRHRDGYGNFWNGRRSVGAHRFAYEHFVAPIAEGMQLDHLCRNPCCVNPAHLEPVTGRENTLRGQSPPASHATVTHCPEGHEYTEANTYLYDGSRYCRRCRYNRKIAHRAALRAAGLPRAY